MLKLGTDMFLDLHISFFILTSRSSKMITKNEMMCIHEVLKVNGSPQHIFALQYVTQAFFTKRNSYRSQYSLSDKNGGCAGINVFKLES